MPDVGLKHSTGMIGNKMCAESVDVKSGGLQNLFQGGYHCRLFTEKNGQ